jgi:hypothetical protein
MAEQQPIIIEHYARGTSGAPGGGPTNFLRRRRWSIAAVLALVEMLYVIFGHPTWFLASLVALLVLGLSVWVIGRLRPGIVRDALIIIAIAQGLVVVIPIATLAGIALGLVLALLVLVGVVVVAFRLRA